MANITVNAKYLKDEQGNIISPVTSSDTIFSPTGGGYTQFLLDKIYPIGSIYLSINSTNPSTLFGGTWEQLKDRFLLGAGDTYTAGSTGGEATHTLTVNEMPSHTHTQNAHYHKLTCGGNAVSVYTDTGVLNGNGFETSSPNTAWVGSNINIGGVKETTATNQNTGGGQAHNNLPPYQTVYMWKRIS